jgi:nucleoid DNA-binding protein
MGWLRDPVELTWPQNNLRAMQVWLVVNFGLTYGDAAKKAKWVRAQMRMKRREVARWPWHEVGMSYTNRLDSDGFRSITKYNPVGRQAEFYAALALSAEIDPDRAFEGFQAIIEALHEAAANLESVTIQGFGRFRTTRRVFMREDDQNVYRESAWMIQFKPAKALRQAIN